MHRLLITGTVAAGVIAMAACSKSNNPAPSSSKAAMTKTATTAMAPAASTNPLMHVSTLPFHAPPFDKITNGDYKPAIDAGMKQQLQEIDAIANNPAPPTFRTRWSRWKKAASC